MRKMYSMHNLFIFILPMFLCVIRHFQSDISDQFRFKAQIARSQHADTRRRRLRASGLAVVQVLGFKCIRCDGEFASKCAADCHCCHPTYTGTECAVPSNIRSLPLTERPDVSVGILRQHSSVPSSRCVNVRIISAIYILYQSFHKTKSQ